MNKILICSHGSLSSGLLNSLKIIVGNVKNIDALTFYENQDGVEDLKKLEEYFKSNVENNIIVMTDLFGGSVNQEIIKLSSKYNNIRIVTGVNFPLLLDLSFRLENGISDGELSSAIEEAKKQLMLVKLDQNTFEDDFDF